MSIFARNLLLFTTEYIFYNETDVLEEDNQVLVIKLMIIKEDNIFFSTDVKYMDKVYVNFL